MKQHYGEKRVRMIYRELGSTGLKAGVIGMGAEHLEGKPFGLIEEVISAANRKGVNMMDLFMPGMEVRRDIGRALRGMRGQFMIQGSIGSVEENGQYSISRDLDACRRYFEDLLPALETDHIDFGMFFFMDTQDALDQVMKNGIADYAWKLKQDGVIRHVGATSHNPLIARRMVEMGLIETLMFSVNPAFDMSPSDATIDMLFSENPGLRTANMDSARMSLYLLCEQKGVGITCMKTLCAGKLLSKEHTPFTSPLSVGQCIHYALSRPAVASVMLGYQSAGEIEEACRYLAMEESEKDYGAVLKAGGNLIDGACVYCSHCQPCPAGIDIASVHRYLDIARLDKAHVPPSVRQHYASLKAGGLACVSCGSCEDRCPFHVQVIQNMAEAAEIFGS